MKENLHVDLRVLSAGRQRQKGPLVDLADLVVR